jgi:DNA polymerase V
MAEKLRKQRCVAEEMVVFAYTNRFKEDAPQTYSNALVAFSQPTSDQRIIISQAVSATKRVFKEGFGYKKAGVVATKIVAESDVMHSLFEDTSTSDREHRITSALDIINSTFGAGTIKLAVQGSGKIKSSSEKQSPHYTTRWSDIPKVSIK